MATRLVRAFSYLVLEERQILTVRRSVEENFAVLVSVAFAARRLPEGSFQGSGEFAERTRSGLVNRV